MNETVSGIRSQYWVAELEIETETEKVSAGDQMLPPLEFGSSPTLLRHKKGISQDCSPSSMVVWYVRCSVVTRQKADLVARKGKLRGWPYLYNDLGKVATVAHLPPKYPMFTRPYSRNYGGKRS